MLIKNINIFHKKHAVFYNHDYKILTKKTESKHKNQQTYG